MSIKYVLFYSCIDVGIQIGDNSSDGFKTAAT